MRHKTKLILAWDRSYWSDEEERLLNDLSPYVDLFKTGLETIFAEDATGVSVATKVRRKSPKPIFLDAKLHDIQTTVYRALVNIAEHREKVQMVTLHAEASKETLRVAAMMHEETGILPLAVTLLTDISDSECVSRYGDTPNNTVLRRVEEVRECGIKGLVCSPQELFFLREKGVLEGMKTVLPGIRSAGSPRDDHKRTMTPNEAVRAKADYVVVGRPVLKYAADPVLAALALRRELDAAHTD